jgi:hypothetical protein
VKIATHFESTRLPDPTDLQGSKPAVLINRSTSSPACSISNIYRTVFRM